MMGTPKALPKFINPTLHSFTCFPSISPYFLFHLYLYYPLTLLFPPNPSACFIQQPDVLHHLLPYIRLTSTTYNCSISTSTITATLPATYTSPQTTSAVTFSITCTPLLFLLSYHFYCYHSYLYHNYFFNL